MEKEEVINLLEDEFPDSDFKLLENFNSGKTKLFVLNQIKNKKNRKIFVKHYPHHKDGRDTLNEFRYQKKFYEYVKDFSNINTPKPVHMDFDNKILVMEYIEGKTLRKLLLEIKQPSIEYLKNITASCGIALAKFHKLFELSESSRYLKDERFYNGYWRKKGSPFESETELKQCGLNSVSDAYGDFGPAQILVKDKKIYLIDFPSPKEKILATPHLDLAKFRFYLKLLNQHPRFLFPKSNWSPNNLYEEFFHQYCKEKEVNWNEFDKENIRDLVKDHIIRKREKLKQQVNESKSIISKLKAHYILYSINRINNN